VENVTTIWLQTAKTCFESLANVHSEACQMLSYSSENQIAIYAVTPAAACKTHVDWGSAFTCEGTKNVFSRVNGTILDLVGSKLEL